MDAHIDLHSTGDAGVSTQHDFVRDKSAVLCVVCQNLWPAAGSIVSKYHRCSVCNATIHTACRELATKCYPCVSGLEHKHLTDLEREHLTCAGQLAVKLLHAYDTSVQAGTSLYGVIKLPLGRESIQTSAATVGEQDVVWDGKSYALQIPAASAGPYPSLTLEIWRSMYFLLDQQLSSVSIPLLPLFIYPNVTAERWFQLKDNEGNPWGMLLLQLTFMPQMSSLVMKSSHREQRSDRCQQEDVPPIIVKSETTRESAIRPASPPPLVSSLPLPPASDELHLEDRDRSEIENEYEKELEFPSVKTLERESIPSFNSMMSSPSATSSHENDLLSDATLEPSSKGAGTEKGRRRIHRAAAPEITFRPRPRADTDPSLNKTVTAKPGRPVPDVPHRKEGDQVEGLSHMPRPGQHSTTVKPSFDTTIRETLPSSRTKTNSTDTAGSFQGVGRLHIFVLSVQRAPSKDSPNGDHYVRVEVGGNEVDSTHTVYQTPHPVFNRKFMADVMNYRTDIRLVLVDASNDRRIGAVDTSTYAVLQRDADLRISWKEAPIQQLPIRENDKIVGQMELKVAFEEDVFGLFMSPHPHLATPSPDELFSVERLRIHIARAQAVYQLVMDAFRAYRSIMNWDTPLWTGFLLFMFIYIALTIDAEYALCAPLFICVALLSWLLIRRQYGHYRQFWVERHGQSDSTALSYRAVAHLKVAIAGYKNLSTKTSNGQLGLPFVKVTYLPYGEAPANSLLPSELLIGCTNTSVTDRLPSHSSPRGTIDTLRSSAIVQSVASFLKLDHAKDAILHNVTDSWRRTDSEVEDQTFVYPILQPIEEEGHLRANTDASQPTASGPAQPSATSSSKSAEKPAASNAQQTPPLGNKQVPWNKSVARLKFTVFGENPATFMAASWGHVYIPMKDLVFDEKIGGTQPEFRQWHDVVWTGKDEDIGSSAYHEDDNASLDIRLQLELRDSKMPPTELELETSRAIQSMLDRNADADKPQSSLSTLWNLRDNVAYVQNILGNLLNNIESFKNLLNWTHPRKTALVYAGMIGIWLAFASIPGRYLILMAGLYQFFQKWIPVPPDDPYTTKYWNLLESIPNDDDLRQIYRLEHEEYLSNKRMHERQKQRRAKLRLVFECQWEGMVKIKTPYWAEKFLVVQGHRLVWWVKEEDLEAGRSPEGQLLLQGHAGTTHASPVDIRDIGDDTRLVCVFGRDSKGGPEKKTFLCSSPADKLELVKAIQSAAGLKAD